MTVPDPLVEIRLSGVWTDITADVQMQRGIDIGQGRGDEGGTSSPSSCALVLNNRTGKYSPRNPTGAYYGSIGRNVPIRVSVQTSAGTFPRFYGELTELPPRWDLSKRNAYAPVAAAGILRRIGQGTQPVGGGLKQYLMTTNPVTYWPLSDGPTATSGAAAIGNFLSTSFHRELGHALVQFTRGELGTWLPPTMALDDTNPSSLDFMSGISWSTDATPDALAFDHLWKVDAETYEGNMAVYSLEYIVEGTTAGTYDSWRFSFRADGTNDDVYGELWIDVYGTTTTVVALGNTAPLTALTDKALHHVRFSLTVDGADVDWAVLIDGASVLSGTRTTFTLRKSVQTRVFYDRVAGEDLLAVGHYINWENLANIPDVADAVLAAFGFAGEAAGRRIERLCAELDVPFTSVGDLDDTLTMGLQYEDQFSSQLAEIEATDRGLIYEPRDSLAIGYRTRASLYNQTAAATLSFSGKEVSPPLEPVDDDQNTRNDVGTQRREGGSYQATLETGPLSVQDPPAGVGRYKDEVTVNVETDADLPAIAGWLLALGTVDEMRYPQLTVNLTRLLKDGKTALVTSLLGIDPGDRIVVTGASSINIYNDISLIVLGYSETIGEIEHTITFNCVPASPYEVNELDDSDSRIDPGDGSTLAEDMTTTETGMDVASAGFLWTTAGGDLPISIMVGGEEMTVTAISGASSPQTFTVTRSANGVVKTHSTGAVVRLKRPGVVAL